MNDTKPWYLSAGVWGAIVGLLASLLSLFKVRLDAQLQSDLRDWVFSFATLVASGVALYGRVRATRRVTLARASAAVMKSAETPPAGAPDSRDGAAAQNWRLNHVLIAPLLLAPLVAHCAGCQQLGTVLGPSPAATYVAADRATFEAVAPEYEAYVRNDPGLDDEGRARRGRTVQTWRLRIESAEGGQRSDGATERRSDEGGNADSSDEATGRLSDEGVESAGDEAPEHGIDRVDE